MSTTSRFEVKQMGECFTLLMVWIYEYFPTLNASEFKPEVEQGLALAARWLPKPARVQARKRSLVEYRKKLDNLLVEQVVWNPYAKYGDDYEEDGLLFYAGMIVNLDIIGLLYLKRTIRQLGFRQTVPEPLRDHDAQKFVLTSKRYVPYYGPSPVWEWSTRNDRRLNHMGTRNDMTTPGAIVPEYMPWYEMVSHLKVCNPNYVRVEEVPPPPPGAKDYEQRFKKMKSRLQKFVKKLKTCEGGQSEPISPETKERMVHIGELIVNEAKDVPSD